MSTSIHATTVSLNGRGVLIRGVPGSGKSELALRLIDQPGQGVGDVPLKGVLVSDDQTILTAREGAVWATAPGSLQGLLEVRGIGLVHLPFVDEVEVALVVDLLQAGSFERLPEVEELFADLEGVRVARIPLDKAQPAAPAIIRMALTAPLKQLC
jgi:HPr kinase/phosphorylase